MMPPHPNPLPRWGEGTFFNLLFLGGNSGDTILNLSKSARRQKKLSMVSPELRVPGAAAGKPFKTLFFGIDFYFRHGKNLFRSWLAVSAYANTGVMHGYGLYEDPAFPVYAVTACRCHCIQSGGSEGERSESSGRCGSRPDVFNQLRKPFPRPHHCRIPFCLQRRQRL